MDGFRALAYISADGCHLISRRGNAFKKFHALTASLSTLPVRTAILDVESDVVGNGSKGRCWLSQNVIGATSSKELK